MPTKLQGQYESKYLWGQFNVVSEKVKRSQNIAVQSVIHHQVASASPVSLPDMENFSPQPRIAQSESAVSQDSQVITMNTGSSRCALLCQISRSIVINEKPSTAVWNTALAEPEVSGNFQENMFMICKTLIQDVTGKAAQITIP